MQRLGPVTLEGTHIRLEPLRPRHWAGILAAGQDESIFAHMLVAVSTPEAVDSWMMNALVAEAAGTEYTFAVVRKADGRVIGSTRFLDVNEKFKSTEIGWTWYERSAWGTAVNPEAKLLLMQHAFETWGAQRVFLKTDVRNTRSQAAIKKLGAQYEGTLRNAAIRRDGSKRDTVVFSVIDTEWPAVKAGLLARLGALSPAG
jgi:RimJ/RimL family protein N-acetyltransferase